MFHFNILSDNSILHTVLLSCEKHVSPKMSVMMWDGEWWLGLAAWEPMGSYRKERIGGIIQVNSNGATPVEGWSAATLLPSFSVNDKRLV